MKYKKQLMSATLVIGVMLGSSVNANTKSPIVKRYFSGPYVDLSTGLSQQRYKSNRVGLNSDLRSNIAVGYSDVLDSNVLLSGEVQLGINQNLNRRLHSGTDRDDIAKTRIVGRSNDLGVLVKIGPMIDTSTALYGIVGTEVAGFKVKTRVNGNEARHKSSMKVGWSLGAGISKYVSRDVSVGLNFIHTMYEHVNAPDLKGVISEIGSGTLTINNKKLKVQSNALLFDIAYRF